jgi:hypothetical protein
LRAIRNLPETSNSLYPSITQDVPVKRLHPSTYVYISIAIYIYRFGAEASLIDCYGRDPTFEPYKIITPHAIFTVSAGTFNPTYKSWNISLDERIENAALQTLVTVRAIYSLGEPDCRVKSSALMLRSVWGSYGRTTLR